MSKYIKNHQKEQKFNPCPPKEDRNNAIVSDRVKNNFSYNQLSKKYGISPQRCYEIVETYAPKGVIA